MENKKIDFKKIFKTIHISFKPGFDADKDWLALAVFFIVCTLCVITLNTVFFFKVQSQNVLSMDTYSESLINKEKFIEVVDFYKKRNEEFLLRSKSVIDAPPKTDIVTP